MKNIMLFFFFIISGYASYQVLFPYHTHFTTIDKVVIISVFILTAIARLNDVKSEDEVKSYTDNAHFEPISGTTVQKVIHFTATAYPTGITKSVNEIIKKISRYYKIPLKNLTIHYSPNLEAGKKPISTDVISLHFKNDTWICFESMKYNPEYNLFLLAIKLPENLKELIGKK